MLGHDVAHLHRPEERDQVLADLARVVAADAGFQQVMWQPFVPDVGLERLLAAPGVTLLACPDASFGFLEM
jgi:hypothetical protein